MIKMADDGTRLYAGKHLSFALLETFGIVKCSRHLLKSSGGNLYSRFHKVVAAYYCRFFVLFIKELFLLSLKISNYGIINDTL